MTSATGDYTNLRIAGETRCYNSCPSWSGNRLENHGAAELHPNVPKVKFAAAANFWRSESGVSGLKGGSDGNLLRQIEDGPLLLRAS